MEAWRAEIRVRDDLPDPAGSAARAALVDAGLPLSGAVRSVRGYLLGAELAEPDVRALVGELLADPVADEFAVHAPSARPRPARRRVCVVPRPGVTDPVAESVRKAMADAGLEPAPTGTYRAFEFDSDAPEDALAGAALAGLANEVIQTVLVDRVPEQLPGPGESADLTVREVALRGLDEDALVRISREGGLALNADEMQAVRAHFERIGRDPTVLELETVAQTWSEHCKHKTLTASIRFEGERIDNLLRSTIAHVTNQLDRDFCVSVFTDNAGIIRFDDEDCVCIKVETHNHPSAIEPFGGAGTGVGGVIRDVLGTGLAARPSREHGRVLPRAARHERPKTVPTGCLHPEQHPARRREPACETTATRWASRP